MKTFSEMFSGFKGIFGVMPPEVKVKRKHDGEILRDLIEEIGFAWVGELTNNCDESPHKKLRRFKLFYTTMTNTSLIAWYGTSIDIPCASSSFPDEDDFIYERNSGRKQLDLSVYMWLDAIPTDPFVERSYTLFVSDKLNILHPSFQDFRKGSKSVLKIAGFLEAIRDDILLSR